MRKKEKTKSMEDNEKEREKKECGRS